MEAQTRMVMGLQQAQTVPLSAGLCRVPYSMDFFSKQSYRKPKAAFCSVLNTSRLWASFLPRVRWPLAHQDKGTEFLTSVSGGLGVQMEMATFQDQLQGDRSALFRVNQCLFNFGKEVGTIQGGQRSSIG